MFPAPPRELDDTLAFLRDARARLEAGKELQVVILVRATGEFIGHGGIHHVDSTTPELGIWIKKGAHGHRYGREAVTALSAWALGHLTFQYLKYPVDRRNIASRRIPESLGGRVEAEYELTGAAGNLLDLVEYHIYRDDLAAALEKAPDQPGLSQTEKYQTQIQKMPGKSSEIDF
jgi:[ribosomal protein S5]-alanine N-acetyltransferase